VCGDAGPADRNRPEVDNRSFRYPGRDALVPGSLTGPALAIGARSSPQQERLAATGPRSGRPRFAMLDDVAWPVTARRWTPLVSTIPSADGGRLPEAPGGARPARGTPRCGPGIRGPECWDPMPALRWTGVCPAGPRGRNRP
jgi:hypothetical protein